MRGSEGKGRELRLDLPFWDEVQLEERRGYAHVGVCCCNKVEGPVKSFTGRHSLERRKEGSSLRVKQVRACWACTKREEKDDDESSDTYLASRRGPREDLSEKRTKLVVFIYISEPSRSKSKRERKMSVKEALLEAIDPAASYRYE